MARSSESIVMAMDSIPEAITKSERAYRGILAMIVNEQLRPGQKIVYRELSERLEMSNIPVIEAVRRLESDRVLERRPHAHIRVRSWSIRDTLEQLYVREALEGVAARLCARHITPEQHADLREICEELARLSDDPSNRGEMLEADIRFHQLIAELSTVRLLVDQLQQMNVLRQTIGQGTLPVHGDAEGHWGVFHAIVSGDEDRAEKIMRRHIQESIDHCEALIAQAKRSERSQDSEEM